MTYISDFEAVFRKECKTHGIDDSIAWANLEAYINNKATRTLIHRGPLNQKDQTKMDSLMIVGNSLVTCSIMHDGHVANVDISCLNVRDILSIKSLVRNDIALIVVSTGLTGFQMYVPSTRAEELIKFTESLVELYDKLKAQITPQ